MFSTQTKKQSFVSNMCAGRVDVHVLARSRFMDISEHISS